MTAHELQAAERERDYARRVVNQLHEAITNAQHLQHLSERRYEEVLRALHDAALRPEAAGGSAE